MPKNKSERFECDKKLPFGKKVFYTMYKESINTLLLYGFIMRSILITANGETSKINVSIALVHLILLIECLL